MAVACQPCHQKDSAGKKGIEMLQTAAMEAESIRTVLREFCTAWNSGDLETLPDVYTDPHIDANRPQPLVGREELLNELRRFFRAYASQIQVTSDEVVVAGEWAFQRGEFELVMTERSNGTARRVRRRYIEVLHRLPDGKWKVHWGIDGSIKDILPQPQANGLDERLQQASRAKEQR